MCKYVHVDRLFSHLYLSSVEKLNLYASRRVKTLPLNAIQIITLSLLD